MKKLTFLILAGLMPFLSSAQDLDKYENMAEDVDVTVSVITSQMFKLLANIDVKADDPETQQYIDIVEKLDEVRVIVSKAPEVRQQMASDVASILKKNPLELLMRVTDNGKTVKFYYKPGKNDNIVNQLFMFMEGKGEEPSVILNITGELSLSQISKLAQKLDIPEGKHLEKIEKEKI